MTADVRQSTVLVLACGLVVACKPREPVEDDGGSPSPSESCADADFAAQHEGLCFGGCKDPANAGTIECVPCVGHEGDPLCGGGCTIDCEEESESESESESEEESTGSGTGTTGTGTGTGTTGTETGTDGESDSETDTDGGDATIVELVAGNAHTCALLSNGAVRCWGVAAGAAQGNGEHVGDDELPSSVPDVDIGGVAIDIDADVHTCVVLDNGGVRCWGPNDLGQLGSGIGAAAIVGDDETPAAWPELWFNPGAADPLNDPPPAGTPLAVAVSVGARGTCVLLDDGRVWCWGGGSPAYEEITIGDNEHASAAFPTTFPVDIAQASTGTSHVCVRTTNDTVRCWGTNFVGELGYGNTNVISDPPSAGDVAIGASVVAMTTGARTTCVITDVPDLRCWGFNENGMLGLGHVNHVGDDETPAASAPTDVGGTPIDACTGSAHSCAVLDDGTVRCFGENDIGHLGYGHYAYVGDDETPANEPAIDFGPGRGAVSIACGQYHTCALLEDGAVRCWGYGGVGALGLGNTDTVIDADDPLVADVEVQ